MEKYPYQHFCGNEYAANDIYIATLYTKSFRGLGDTKNDLNYSLPHIFYNGLADNQEIIEITVEILKENFDIKEIEEAFRKACTEYYSEKVKMKKYEWTIYCITFLDTKIELSFYQLEFTKNIDKTIKENIEKSYFKKLITK